MSVVDEIVEQLTRRIISGEWPPGSAIPSLRVFAAEMGVSTLTVREAIRTLQVRGLVETRHGAGTFVRSPDPDDGTVAWMLSPTETDEFLELIEARKAIEDELLRLAVLRCTADQLQQLADIVATMAASRTDAARFLEADLRFHITLAEAAHNRVLLRTMLAIRGPLKRLIANRTVRHLEQVGNLDESIRDHEEIVDALARRDSEPGDAALTNIVRRGEEHVRSLRDEELAQVTSAGAATRKDGGEP